MFRCLRAGNTDWGFTLVEVLVSLAAMAIGFTILMGMHYSSIRMEMSDQRRIHALEIARRNLEILRDPNELNKFGTGWDKCPDLNLGPFSCVVTTDPILPNSVENAPPDRVWKETPLLTVEVRWSERPTMSKGRTALQETTNSTVKLTKWLNGAHQFPPKP